MQVFSYSEARQKLATGKVIIRRKDGRTFALVPEKIAFSPLDVPSIKAKVTTDEITLNSDGYYRAALNFCSNTGLGDWPMREELLPKERGRANDISQKEA